MLFMTDAAMTLANPAHWSVSDAGQSALYIGFTTITGRKPVSFC